MHPYPIEITNLSKTNTTTAKYLQITKLGQVILQKENEGILNNVQ